MLGNSPSLAFIAHAKDEEKRCHHKYSPLLALNAEGKMACFYYKEKDCCRNSTTFPPGLTPWMHPNRLVFFSVGLNTELLQNKLNTSICSREYFQTCTGPILDGQFGEALMALIPVKYKQMLHPLQV